MVFALTLVCVATQLAVPVSAFAADDNASDVPATVVGDNRRFTGVDFTEPSAEQWELFRVDNLDDKTLYIDVTKKVGDGEAKHLVRRSPYVPDPQADKDFGGKGVAHIVTLAMAGEDGKPLAPQDVFDNEADRAEYGIAVYAAQRGGQPLYEATIYPVYAVRTDADGARVDTPKLVGIRTASADEVGRAKNMGMGDSYYATAEDGSQETYALEKVGNVDNAFDAQAGAYYLTYKKTAAGSVEGVVNYVDEEGNMVEHHQVQRGLRLIYCHFFVVIAVNLLTVAINLMVLEGEPGLGACALGAAAIGLYFLCLYLLYPYRRAGLAISRAQWVVLVCFVAVGMAVALLGAVTGALGFILGPVIAAGGCFGLLYKKDKGLV